MKDLHRYQKSLYLKIALSPNRRLIMDAIFDSPANIGCVWPKCQRKNRRDTKDMDAYFCYKHCPVCHMGEDR